MDDRAGIAGSDSPAPWEADPFAPPPAGIAGPEPVTGEETPRPALPTTIRAVLGATFDAYATDAIPILALSALYGALSVVAAVAPPPGILLAVTWPIVTAMWVAIVGERLRTGSVQPGRAISTGLRRAFWVLIWSLLVGLAIGGLALLGAIAGGALAALLGPGVDAVTGLVGGLLIGALGAALAAAGLFLVARWSLAVPAIVLAGEGPLSGSRRSADLVRGRTARFAGLVVVLGVVAYAPTLVAFVPALLSRGDLAVAAVTGALGVLTYPVLPIACTVAYARLERIAVKPALPRPRFAPALAVAVGGVAVASLLVGLVGGSTLAGDLWSVTADRGTVVAGSGLEIDRCRVSGETDRFEIGKPVAVLGILARQLPAGETVVLAIFRDGLPIGRAGSDPFDEPVDCVGGMYEPGDIVSFGGPGRYRLEYRLGNELLASGEFEVVAAGGSGAPPAATAGEPSSRPAVASAATAPPRPSVPASAGPGTVRFGRAAGADACSVSMVPIAFGVGDRVYLAANLGRPVSAGEEVRVAVRFGGDEIAADTLVADETTACLDGYLPTSGLASGRYTVQFRAAGELLAEGELELAP